MLCGGDGRPGTSREEAEAVIKVCGDCGEQYEAKASAIRCFECRKAAHNAASKRYLQRHPQRRKETLQRSAKKLREYIKEWNKKNPHKRREYSNRWKKANPESVKTYQKMVRRRRKRRQLELQFLAAQSKVAEYGSANETQE